RGRRDHAAGRVGEVGAPDLPARIGVGGAADVEVVRDAADGLGMALRVAAVTGDGVAVVALLARVEDAVAAGLDLAGRAAAVARDRVAVVALLARFEATVSARGLDLAGGAAAVARDLVPVVALLARVEDAVAADLDLA